MNARLGYIQAERISVECTSCNRRGSYSVARLKARFDPGMSDLDLLRSLTASCRHQHAPGSAAPRKYEVKCQARLVIPPPLEAEAPPEPYPLEIWRDRSIERCVAAIWGLKLAERAFGLAVELWPDRRITLRQKIRIIQKHPPDGVW